MNIKTLFVSLAAGLIAFSSCNDDFLEMKPSDFVSDANFWDNEENLISVCNTMTASLVGKDWINRTEIMADTAPWAEKTAYRNIGGGNYDSMDGKIDGLWRKLYTNIGRVNYFLDNYQRTVNVPEEIRERYAAEAYFYKAFNYLLLTSYFGDVPYIEHSLTTTSPELYKGRDPKNDIIKRITDDLEARYKYLPTYIPAASPQFGRVTQGAALCLLSRIYLYNEMWDKAVDACERAMALPYYGLYSTGKPEEDYVNLFNYKGRASRNPANHETYLAFIYNYDLGASARTSHNLSRECWVPDGYARFIPTMAIVSAYLTSDGQIWRPKDCETYEDVFKNRDPRMCQSILAPGTKWAGGECVDKLNDNKEIFTYPLLKTTGKTSETRSGFYMRKYVEPSIVRYVGHDDNDIVLFRYAEVLLNYAEAKEMMGVLSQADLDKSINKLRDRVGMVHLELGNLPTGSDIRTEIRRERDVELFFEGHRFFDLRRWKRGDVFAEDLIGINRKWIDETRFIEPFALENSKWVNKDGEKYLLIESGRTFDPSKHYLFPIPVAQRALNSNLTQNPGWD